MHLALLLVFTLHDSFLKLAEATEKIRSLTVENTRLLSNQVLDNTIAHERNQLQKELNDIRSENRSLIDKVSVYLLLPVCLLKPISLPGTPIGSRACTRPRCTRL